MRRNNRFAILLTIAAIVLALNAFADGKPVQKAKALTFEKKVLPILQARCIRCHGEKKRRAGLDLRSKGLMIHGGESGPAIVPASAKDSLLWKKVITDKMPPGKAKLSQAEKGIIRAWIDGGAHALNTKVVKSNDIADGQVTDEDRRFWSFQPPKRPAVPAVKNKKRVRNPIDAFVLARLEEKGLTLSPEADRLTLLRRACFDLHGLPPTPKQINEFLRESDAKPQAAYEKLIDRLLASPRYGERWARHWLDAAGYADSEGILDADYVRQAAWRYRDYVIRAFNSDKPYDRFLKEQIAGDELVDYWQVYRTQKKLPPQVVEALIATGYLRCASDTSRPDFVKIKNAPGYYFQTLDDTVKIVTSSTLGLTVGCAKCHSHKYDPIPQRDYYRIQSVFMSGYRPSQWIPQVKRQLLEATADEEKRAKVHNDAISKTIAGNKSQIKALQKNFADRLFKDRLAELPAAIRTDVRTAFNTAAKKRTAEQKALVKKYQANLVTAPKALPKVLSAKYPEFVKQTKHLNASIQAEEKKRITFPRIRAFYDLPGDAATHLLRRGDYLHPGPEVRPGALAVLATPKPFTWKQPPEKTRTSGRRLAFANWITQRDHPLTSRVFVNRLWHHHFGQGIVSTPENFGRAGKRPSHPELLDWLATEFIRRGWSVKEMHRLIMTSSVYRQKSGVRSRGSEVRGQRSEVRGQKSAKPTDGGRWVNPQSTDPENHLLWRQRLRRLEAEALRDAILYVSGKLNLKMYGVPIPMQRRPDGEIVVGSDNYSSRRSIYLQVRRSKPLAFLQAFDQPVMQTNCTRRDTSTVSSQALTLLNSEFMVRQAKAFALRVLRESPKDPAGHALLTAFARPATDSERRILSKFLADQGALHLQTLAKGKGPTAEQRTQARQNAVADLCHMLMSANEFAYVD